MSTTWLIIRGSGFAAFALLTASVVWGLMVSTKTLGRSVKAKGLTGLHEALGLGAVVAVIIHMVALSFDEFIPFAWKDLLIPGFATWRPIASALGVVAFWMMVVVAGSFYVKKWIGPVVWKVIHRMSLGVFVTALIHTVLSGTDIGNPIAVATLAAAVSAVGLLVLTRILAARHASQAPPARAARTPPAAPGRDRPVEESDGVKASEKVPARRVDS